MTGYATGDRLQALVDAVYIVNLESRPDRRREMLTELQRIGLSFDDAQVHIFRAVRPEAAGPFPAIGARGCFLSQLGVLKQAAERQDRAILLLEDDAAFSAGFVSGGAAVLEELGGLDWSIAYLGHRIAPEQFPVPGRAETEHWRLLPPEVGVVCAHAVLFRHSAIAALIPYLERMLARPAGHAEGGPMHVDGAYSWFRREHPDIRTMVTSQQYVDQRASRSDIAPASWKNKLPLVDWLRSARNRLTRRR